MKFLNITPFYFRPQNRRFKRWNSNYGLAKQILIDGEQAAEEAFVAKDE